MDKIVCVGKNYSEHAQELGEQMPAKPVLFLKPPSVLRAAVQDETNLELYIPPDSGTLHYETEIVLRLEKGGYRLDVKEAEKIIGAVTVGLDMTLRDKQKILKEAGHPWTTSKVFPDAAVVGPWLRISEFQDYLNQKFTFTLDGEMKQQEFAKNMFFSPAECVSYISSFMALMPGDIIFTGTPKGVGPVKSGQKGTLSWGPIRYSVEWKTRN